MTSPGARPRFFFDELRKRSGLPLSFIIIVLALATFQANADEAEKLLAEQIFASPNLAPVLPADDHPVVRLIAIVDPTGTVLPIGAPIRVDPRELRADVTQSARRAERPELLAIATDTGVDGGEAYWAPVRVSRNLFFDRAPEAPASSDPDASPVQFQGGQQSMSSGVAIVTLPFYSSGRVEFYRPSSLTSLVPAAQRALKINFGRTAPPMVGAP